MGNQQGQICKAKDLGLIKTGHFGGLKNNFKNSMQQQIVDPSI